MERQTDFNAPVLVGEGGAVIRPEETVHHLSTPEALERQKELIVARDRAVRALLTDADQVKDGDKTIIVKSGFQKFARAFYIDCRVVHTDGWWEKLEFEELPHYVAEAEVLAIAPWGQRVSIRRRCTTREDKFGKWENGAFLPYHKKRQRAEADCLAIAETRARNACVDHLMALGKVEDLEGSEDELERRAEKQRMNRLLDAQKEWQRLLTEHEVDGDDEFAFYEMHPRLPDHEQDFALEDYQLCIGNLKRHGIKMFSQAVEARQKRDAEKERVGDPVAAAEDELEGTGEEPPSEPDPEPEAGSAEEFFTDEEIERAKPAEKREPTEREVRREKIADSERRATLIAKAEDLCKQLGEDPQVYLQEVACSVLPDRREADEEEGTVRVRLFQISPEEMQRIVEALEKQAAGAEGVA